jgi:hypothetical protein
MTCIVNICHCCFVQHKNRRAITAFFMSGEDFECHHDGCKLHYIEPCDICTKCFCDEHLPFSQHVCVSPNTRREEHAQAQSSFYSDSYATETSDDYTQFSGSDRPYSSSSFNFATSVDRHYQIQSSARSTASLSTVPLSLSSTPTISACRSTSSSSTIPLSLSLHLVQQLRRVPYIYHHQRLQPTLHLCFKGLH